MNKYVDNKGYLTLEVAIVFITVLIILSSFVVMTVYYHDFIMSKVAVNDSVFRAYYNDYRDLNSGGIVADETIYNSRRENFLYEYNSAALIPSKSLKVFGFSFNVSQNQSRRKVKRKVFVNLIDMGDNALGIFDELRTNKVVKEKVKELQDLIK